MTPAEVQCYMRALFTALRNVHSHHVIHRDIKPSNFLYHRDSGRLCVRVRVRVRVCVCVLKVLNFVSFRFRLVDFGLAHLAPTTSSKSQSGILSAYIDIYVVYECRVSREQHGVNRVV